MSRLYIKDLENILKGKVVRYSINTKNKCNSLISLAIVNNEIEESRNLRNKIINLLEYDIDSELKKNNLQNNIILYPENLFFDKYFKIIVSEDSENIECLLSDIGIVAASDTNDLLLKKIELILPYVKKILEVKNNTHIFNNEFYEDLNVLNKDDVVLNISGAGINLPFDIYNEFNEYDLRELLTYFYFNYSDILKNILVNNALELDRYTPEENPQKILKLYKDIK